MKGLLIKDYKLILNQKNFFCLMIALSVGMLLFSDDVIFPLGFLIFVISLFTISTISYDDCNSCHDSTISTQIWRRKRKDRINWSFRNNRHNRYCDQSNLNFNLSHQHKLTIRKYSHYQYQRVGWPIDPNCIHLFMDFL